jgi:hypothetical protein
MKIRLNYRLRNMERLKKNVKGMILSEIIKQLGYLRSLKKALTEVLSLGHPRVNFSRSDKEVAYEAHV